VRAYASPVLKCPSCGSENTLEAKFCSECGARLASAPRPIEERKVVTVVFCDLVGSTARAEQLDPEDVRAELSSYHARVRSELERHGGTVEKFIGDAVVAVFGAPLVHEDDPERAVRAALAIRDWALEEDAVDVRVAVNTGEALVSVDARADEGLVAGDVINTAARLQSAAPVNGILVGEKTYRATEANIEYRERGPVDAKGKQEPVAVWEVASARSLFGVDVDLEPSTRLVGRRRELDLLLDALGRARAEHEPQLVTIVGVPGMGKSRLVQELSARIEADPELIRWRQGRSLPYGEGVSYWALGEMVKAEAGILESDEAAVAESKLHETVARVCGEQESEWLRQMLHPLVGIADDASGGDRRGEAFAAWRRFVEGLAAERATVLVFEDLHWADDNLLDFVDYLVDWATDSPLLVLGTARPELLERRPDWGAGKRTFAGIHLEPLAPAAMRELLAGLVPGLSAKAAEGIVTRADGIPLYAVETVRMLLAQGRLVAVDGAYKPSGPLDDLAVPETLTALIAARLDALDAVDRALIEDAAVLGQSFTLAGLSAVSGKDKADIEARLLAMVRRELLILDADPRSPERGQYRFVQALIREVAYNTLAKKDRKQRHLAAARHFESLGTDELAGGLAGHYLAAQQLAADAAEAAALGTQARIALRGAAERAAALGSHEQALNFLNQALQVTTDARERADLHERALTSANTLLDTEAALRHAAAVVEARRELGDRPAIAEAIAEHGLAITGIDLAPARSLKMLMAAWEEFGDLEETPAGVRLMFSIERAHGILNENAAQLEWIERLLPIAERFDLLEQIASGLLGRGAALVKLDRSREGLMLLRGAHAFALTQGFGLVEYGARILLTFWEQWNEPGVGVALAREGLEIARRIGSRNYAWGMVGNGVVCAFRTGEWEWASALLEEWLTTETFTPAHTELLADRAILRALRGEDASGDIGEAKRLRTGITDTQFESYELWARAYVHLVGGRLRDARIDAEQAASTTSFFRAMAWPVAARAALWEGDIEAATARVKELDESGLRGLAIDLDRVTFRAGLAALEGRILDAIAGYREALKGYRSLGVEFDLAMAALDLAILVPGAERRAPDLEEALVGAAAIFGRLGAGPMLDRLEAALAEVPVPAPSRLSARSAAMPL
jgi:class 3 adenylate cyclase